MGTEGIGEEVSTTVESPVGAKKYFLHFRLFFIKDGSEIRF
jgi:hypothetical protein